MALVKDGRALIGGKLHVTTPTGFAEVKVGAPIFFDAKGERVHG